MVFLFVATHIMLTAMCAIIFSLYSIFAGAKKGTWYLGPLAFVLGILTSGIVLLPALLGDVVTGSSSSTANRMSDWSQNLLLSLSVTTRQQGETSCTFGLAMFAIAIVIIIFGKRKAGAIIGLIFFVLSADAFLPLVSHMPLPQAWWMLRYVQMCYVLICYEWGFLEFKKKGLIWLTLVAVLLDTAPSYFYFTQIEEPVSGENLLDEAADLTSNRMGPCG